MFPRLSVRALAETMKGAIKPQTFIQVLASELILSFLVSLSNDCICATCTLSSSLQSSTLQEVRWFQRKIYDNYMYSDGDRKFHIVLAGSTDGEYLDLRVKFSAGMFCRRRVDLAQLQVHCI